MLVALLGSSALAAPPAPDWQLVGGSARSMFGQVVAGAGDLDGDGFGDVAVSAPARSRVSVVLGGLGGLAAAPVAELSGQAGTRFGDVVCGAGDVDGDGYDDLVIGAPDQRTYYGSEGLASLYPGGPSGPAAAPGWTYSPHEPFGAFPSACAGLDLNLDGYADVVFGSPYTSTNGELLVFFGGAKGLGSTPDQVLQGASFEGLGTQVAPAGDVNADGYPDLIVGSMTAEDGEDGEGRARLYLGGPYGLQPVPAWTWEPDVLYASLGTVTGAGDVDGDGYDDVAVGALSEAVTASQEGVVRVFRGGPGGLSPVPVVQLSSGQEGARLGISLAGGDIDGDGYGDLVLGASGWDQLFPDDGRIQVHLGGPLGIDPAPAWTAHGGQALAALGQSVATEDVTGDGVLDILAGAHGYANFTGAAFAWWVVIDDDADGWPLPEDCDDADPAIHPGAPDPFADGIDQDCDGRDADLGVGDLVPGDLLITEVMADPQAVGDAAGEWIEVVVLAPGPLDLVGLQLALVGSDVGVVATSLVVEAGDRVVLGASDDVSSNGGAPVDRAWGGGLSLASGDTLELRAGDEAIDSLVLPVSAAGVSMALSPAAEASGSNDDPSAWCPSTRPYGDGDLGSPGAPNDDACLPDTTPTEPDPTEPSPEPEAPAERGGCGCAGAAGSGVGAGWLALLALLAQCRRGGSPTHPAAPLEPGSRGSKRFSTGTTRGSCSRGRNSKKVVGQWHWLSCSRYYARV